MARYRYLAVDLVTGQVRDELPLTGCTYGQVLNGAAEFAGTIRHDHPKLSPLTLTAARTQVVVERNGQVVGDGIVWSPQVQEAGGAATRVAELQGQSLASWLEGQRLRETRTYAGVPQNVLAADLVAWAQGRGNVAYGPSAGPAAAELDILTDGQPAGSTPRDRTYRGFERHSIAELLENLGDVQGGPRWRMAVAWEGQGEARQLTRRFIAGGQTAHLADPLVYGTNVTDYTYGQLGSRLATVVDAIGEGEGDDQLIRTAWDAGAQPAYPYMVGVVPRKSVSQPATLLGHAEDELALRRRPPELVTVVLAHDTTPRIGTYLPGDTARVVISDGWVQIDAVRRITEVSVTVDREGREQPRITFDNPGAE